VQWPFIDASTGKEDTRVGFLRETCHDELATRRTLSSGIIRHWLFCGWNPPASILTWLTQCSTSEPNQFIYRFMKEITVYYKKLRLRLLFL
jgi:hypothetical protein